MKIFYVQKVLKNKQNFDKMKIVEVQNVLKINLKYQKNWKYSKSKNFQKIISKNAKSKKKAKLRIGINISLHY